MNSIYDQFYYSLLFSFHKFNRLWQWYTHYRLHYFHSIAVMYSQHLHLLGFSFYCILSNYYFVNFMLYYFDLWELYGSLLSPLTAFSCNNCWCILTAISLNNSFIPVPSLALTSKLPQAPIDCAYCSLSYADTSWR